ncbi:WUSCHEL-related homeobox 8-like [Zingiber officinale]|uniref:WUSCHEL-related homeobox 8-like n=1 Tax=Zingiber officinale TaxID=94328 RepID=UPI001C4BFDB1|nr:WUSCHEL-related homeobox 8-like [Zingiber officinale]
MENTALCGKVMTDDQIDTLRRQIAAYSTICEQLAEMHRETTLRQESFTGMGMTSLYSDSAMACGSSKISARQRWTPTPMQLQILESIFYQGSGTPNKQGIKDITAKLAEHGQISETNVYNWFQNRRARSKRKQANPTQNNAESEEAESLNAKRARTEKLVPQSSNLSPVSDDHLFQDVSSELRFVDQDHGGSRAVYSFIDASKVANGSGGMAVFGNSWSNPSW